MRPPPPAVRGGRTRAPIGMRAGVAQHARIAFGDHPAGIRIGAAIQHDAAVGNRQDRGKLVRHHDECRAEILAQVEDQPIEAGGGDRVEPGRRLVEQQQRRIERHRPRDAGAPRHAAGDLRRHQRGGIAQADQAELHPRHRLAAFRRQVGEHLQRQHDVLEQRHRAEQRARLEHHADPALHARAAPPRRPGR